VETLLSSGYQGTVYLLEENGRRYVVKRPSGTLLSGWARRAMLRREYAAYRRLEGIPGVPACFGLGPDGELKLEFVDGESLRHAGYALPDKTAFFARFFELVQAIHAAGVAHADMKRKDNILVDDAGQPWLIDFGSAVLANADGRGWAFRQACRMDLNAWFKIKYQFLPGEPDASDLVHFRPTRVERWARAVRRAWRKLTRRQQRMAARRD
jgi:predicted Ser/Thr protein kinase